MHFNSLWDQNEEIEKIRIKPVKIDPNLSIYLALALSLLLYAKECPRRDLNPHAITGNGF